MRKLIVRGDPGIRRDAVVEYDGQELQVFSVQVQGEFHGPDEPQLWCTVGTEDERETFERRQFVPHWLDVESVDAEAVTVLQRGGELNV
ncbi:HAH_0734 family protein [Halobaculum sp. MBLA0143]|uniref:HAH_0734 family protein n=1 Tax=Halobaculum sp. MBLA0143 TaxID=3079933 RepID=UPI0035237E90